MTVLHLLNSPKAVAALTVHQFADTDYISQSPHDSSRSVLQSDGKAVSQVKSQINDQSHRSGGQCGEGSHLITLSQHDESVQVKRGERNKTSI